VLLIHLLLFATLISWRDLRTHLIPKRLTHLAIASLAPFLIDSAYTGIALALTNYLLYRSLNFFSSNAIGLGDIRLSILIGGYVAGLGGEFSDLIWCNAMSWISCFFALLFHLLRRRGLMVQRVAFAPFMFFGVIYYAVRG